MLWIKAWHVIFMVTWFAGLFYLPRLFVYHASATDSAGIERFRVMERRLFAIMTMGAGLTAAFGIWLLVINPALLDAGWMQAKLALHFPDFRADDRLSSKLSVSSRHKTCPVGRLQWQPASAQRLQADLLAEVMLQNLFQADRTPPALREMARVKAPRPVADLRPGVQGHGRSQPIPRG